MKKIIYLLFLSLFTFSLCAQEFIFEDLPEAVQEELLAQEGVVDNDPEQEDDQNGNENNYYSGPDRDMVTDTFYYYRWDKDLEQWINHYRKIKTYDALGLMVNLEMQHWTFEGEWENGILITYLNNTAGKPYEIVTQVWHPEEEQYLDYFKRIHDYIDDTLLSQVTLLKWHYDNQEWANRKKLSRTFDSNNLLASDTAFIWGHFTDEWKYIRLNEYDYDQQNYRSEVLTSIWQFMNMEWKEVTRSLIENTNGLPDTITMQVWIGFFDEWANMKRVVNTYDAAGMLIEKRIQRWFHMTNLWSDRHQHIYTYNEDGKIDEIVFQMWSPFMQEWLNKHLDAFTYDESGSLIEHLTQLWHYQDSSWVNFRLMQVVIDYKSTFTVIGEPGILNLGEEMIYQNPGTSDQPISFKSLREGSAYRFRMYNVAGSVIMDVYVNDGDRIVTTGNPESGIYILMLTRDGEPAATEKLIISGD